MQPDYKQVSDHLAQLAQNPFVLIGESPEVNIAGLSDSKKLALAEKIEDFLDSNQAAITAGAYAAQNKASLLVLQQKCGNLNFPIDSAEKVNGCFLTLLPACQKNIGSATNAASDPNDSLAQLYYGKLPKAFAQIKLTGLPLGTYLIRDSEIHPGQKIFSFVSSEGVKHYRLQTIAEGFKDESGTLYPTAQAFLETKKTELLLPWKKTPEVAPQAGKNITQGTLNPLEAKIRLLGMNPGTYLIRSSNIVPGVNIVNYVNASGDVKELILVPKDSGGYQCKENMSATFANLDEFITSKAADLKYPMPHQPIVQQEAPSSNPFSMHASFITVLPMPAAAEGSSHEALKQALIKMFKLELQADAQEKLKDKPVGTYLVRDSQVDQKNKVINYVDSTGKVQALRLTAVENGFKFETTIYPTIEAFIESKKDLLKTLFV